MNFYPFHIGDYGTSTSHLSPIEDLVYRRILDLYYAKDGCIPSTAQAVARLIRLDEFLQDVESVLSEFFSLGAAGFSNKRADAEISKMLDKQAKARASAEASVKARQKAAIERSADAKRTQSGGLADVQRTFNDEGQGESHKKKKRSPRSNKKAEKPGEVSKKIWDAFLVLRDKRRAPVTDVVMEGLVREAKAAGIQLEEALKSCIEWNWQGFTAEWYLSRKGKIQKGSSISSNFGQKEYGESGKI